MQKGTITALSIVEGATRLLAEVGYANLSLRGVADHIGISVGNLTYHFPTKAKLMHTVVDQVAALYTRWFSNLETSEEDPVVQLRSVVTYLVESSATTDTARLFRELWAMATHDDVVEASLARLYESAYEAIGALLLKVNPNITDCCIREAVTMIGLASEGSCVLNSERYEFLSTPEEVAERTMTNVLQLIEGRHAPVAPLTIHGKRS